MSADEVPGSLLFRFQRPTLVLVGLMSVFGAAAWLTMPRAEDPSFPDWIGSVTVVYPGAAPTTIEESVIVPLENELSSVSQVLHVDVRIQSSFAVAIVYLCENLSETETLAAWNDVQQALERASAEFPESAHAPELRHHFDDTEGVLIAVTGTEDLIALSTAADHVEARLLGLPGVERVSRSPRVDPIAAVGASDETFGQLGLTRPLLAAQLVGRASPLPSAVVRVADRNAEIDSDVEYHSLDDIAATPIEVAGGRTIPLGEMATVRLEATEEEGRSRFDGEPAIVLGVTTRDGANVVDVGESVRALLGELRVELPEVQLDPFAFQPDLVEERLDSLLGSLFAGIALLMVTLVVFMGVRMSVTVALLVPMIAAASVGIYAAGGGVLQQVSVAAFVIALGIIVDNAIVVIDEMQEQIDAGTPARIAATRTVRSLAVPLATGTGTTMAAFLPMLLADGLAASFTRSLPIVMMITLAVSYFFAVLVAPLFAVYLLRPRAQRKTWTWPTRVSSAIGQLAVGRPKTVLAVATVLVLATAAMGVFVDLDFLPHAGRREVLVTMVHPHETHFETVDDSSRQLEAVVSRMPDVESVVASIGRTTPKFFYNLFPPSRYPERAELVITGRDGCDVDALMSRVRREAERKVPTAVTIVRRLRQGPFERAPVSIRVYGDDEELRQAQVDRIQRLLRGIDGARDVRNSVGAGLPTVTLAIDDGAARRRGVTRTDVARALLGRTRGIPVGEVQGRGDPIPVIVRSPSPEDLPSEELAGLDVASHPPAVRLGEISTSEVAWSRAIIERRDRRRVTVIDSELDAGTTAAEVVGELRRRLEPDALPAGIDVEYAGSEASAMTANTAIVKAMPLAMLVLVMILLLEFNSIRKLCLILVTVPLAVVGVVPGLLAGDQAFDFMSFIGTVSLIGMVVNNAIILIDFIDREVASGVPVDEAVRTSVQRRMRPILLTAGTTVGGLVPLAFSAAPLWPPMAWPMMSGLTASTALTLLVVPAMYRLALSPRRPAVAT